MNIQEEMKERIDVAAGRKKADLVIKNARIFDVFTGEFFEGDLAVSGGVIAAIGSYEGKEEVDGSGKTIVPGFMDGHVHLESSTVTPKQYAKVAVPHGTTAVMADPHEIANVCGNAGIDYMLKASENLPLDVYVMVPSCVPASPFDESGYVLKAEDIKKYLDNERVLGLAEMMNYPGVIAADSEVVKKIAYTQEAGKVTDGHAPSLRGNDVNAYITAGIYSDHENETVDEAIDKIRRGQWVMVREGTVCKNLEDLLPLCREPYYRRCMFVTDDKHAGDIKREGHIDHIIKRAISLGVDPKVAYTMATLNPALHFKVSNSGAICPGYKADFLILDDFEKVDINQVYKSGKLVYDKAEGDKVIFDWKDEYKADDAITNTVNFDDVSAEDLKIADKAKVIGLVPKGVLTTDEGWADDCNLSKDIIKLAVVERHHKTGHIGLCYVKGYGLKEGAIATSIAHDSHNIICVGCNDEDMAVAINELKKTKGGMAVVKDGKVINELALPIAGLICDLEADISQKKLSEIKDAARALGVSEKMDPLLNMSFASLAVIPKLRLTTLGVVDVVKFELVK